MEFLVLNRREIKQYETNKKHIVISVSDPEAKNYPNLPVSDFRLGILYMRFPDFDRPYYEGYEYNNLLFNESFAKDILRFINQYKDRIELIICQCEAGVSRSPAIAGALSKILNGDDSYIFKHYLPNMLVYRMILEEANKCGLL